MENHSEKIRRELLELIGGMRAGERIPNELHLAEFFGVSRMTVNRVVTQLAVEGRLLRVRGKGSFVAKKRSGRMVVTILLSSGDMTPPFMQHIIAGVTSSAGKAGIGVELVPVAPDNNQDHIDFSAVEHLTEHSHVIVVSNWFHRIFPFLRERGCRTLLMDRQLLQFASGNGSVHDFQVLDSDMGAMVHNAFQRLYDAGCRRIAFRGCRPILHSITCHYYGKELEKQRLKGLLLGRDGMDLRLSESERKELDDFKGDGILFDASCATSLIGHDFNAVANIPSGVKCEVIRFNPLYSFLDVNPSSESIDGRRLGEEAVNMLLDPKRPGYRMLEPEYYPAASGCRVVPVPDII